MICTVIVSPKYADEARQREPSETQFPGDRSAISGLRYYSPSTGRWLSREVLGEEASPNLLINGSNDLFNRIDVLGLYEVDVHRFLTQFLAANAGFGDLAGLVGRAAQSLDDPMDPRDAMAGSGPVPMNRQNMSKYHFVTPEQLAELRKKAFESCSCGTSNDFTAIGEYIHALEDSYSHSKGRTDRNWKYYGHPHGLGHGPQGHSPDWTWKRPEKANRMAQEVFSELQELAKACKMNGPVKNWEDISGQVDAFNTYKPKSFFVQYLIPFVRQVTFEGYDTKIKTLDPGFNLDPLYEQGYRRSKKRP